MNNIIKKTGFALVVLYFLQLSAAQAFIGEGGQGYASTPNNLIYPNNQYATVLGQPMDVLPRGYMTFIVGGEAFFYSNGIYYQKNFRDQKYLVVAPPVGAIIPQIPAGYQMVNVDGVYYYEYNGVFYQRVLEGYRIINAPVVPI